MLTSDKANKTTRYALIAACMMHCEGFYSVKSLAFKNRNPGNIEHSSGSMILYQTIQDGFDALVNDIAKNAGKSLQSFIMKYAPPSENNTSLYAQLVSQLTGIKLTENI